MPFDVTEAPLALHRSLDAVASEFGVIPVPMDVLNKHKVEQLRKHPGSWVYGHKAIASKLLGIVMLIPLVCFVVSALLASIFNNAGAMYLTQTQFFGQMISISAMVLMIVAFSGCFIAGTMRFKGPAMWRETSFHSYEMLRLTLRSDFGVPDSIATMAEHLIKQLPHTAYISVGRLIQDSVTIDPYLTISLRGECICLGIWDKTILHEATRV